MFLMLEIIKKIASLVIILITMQFGPLYMALGAIVGSILSQIINSWPNRKLLNYKYFEQITDIIPYIFLSVLMAIAVYSIGFLKLSNYITLAIQIPVGIVIYVGFSWIFKLDSFAYCFDIIKELIRRGK